MGQRLKRLRKATGMSQPQLAEKMEVPVSTIRNWEQDRRVPRLDTAVILARALGVTLDELAGAIGETANQSPASEGSDQVKRSGKKNAPEHEEPPKPGKKKPAKE